MDGHQARIVARIWDDPEWCALPLDAQWLYQSGLSQREIQPSGVLPLRESRWAGLAADTDTEVIEGAIKRLADTRFWVIDHETGEVLYRSYMRTMEVWRYPNQLKSACVAAAAARGPEVRATLLRELLRFPAEHVQRLRPARKGHRRPWLVYVETVAALRGDVADGAGDDAPLSDQAELGQLELPDGPFSRSDQTDQLGQLTSGVTPGLPNNDSDALDLTAHAATPSLPNGLPKGLPNHMNYVVGGTSSQSGLTTSVVTCAPRTRAPAPASAPASPPDPPPPFVVEAVPDLPSDDEPEPEIAADPETLQAIAMARRRRKQDRSFLAQPSLHVRSIGLVAELVVDWSLPPRGRELTKWRVAVSDLLRDAVPEDAIARGAAACVGKGFGPAALPSFVFGEANRGRPDSRAGRAVKATLSHIGDDDGPGLAAFVPGAIFSGRVEPNPPRGIGPGNG